MRRGGWAVVLLLCVAAGAQTTPEASQKDHEKATLDRLQALQHGSLVVWLVHPVGTSKRPSGMATPEFRVAEPGFHEATPSTLGQTSGSFGQAAGSYGVDASSSAISVPAEGAATRTPGAPGDPHAMGGPGYAEQTSGSYGQTAGTFGTDASNHGQTAGSLGQTAGSYGLNAGNVGRTAGSFGESLSTIATAGQPKVLGKPAKPLREELQGRLAIGYPGLHTSFVDVDGDKLLDRLKASSDTTAPDVLLFVDFTVGWAGPNADVLAMGVSSSGGYPPTRDSKPGTRLSWQCIVLRKAPHPKVAGAFLEMLQGAGLLGVAGK